MPLGRNQAFGTLKTVETGGKQTNRSREERMIERAKGTMERQEEGGERRPPLLLFSSLGISAEGEYDLLPSRFSSFARFVLILLYFH